jgi:methylated-DNA-[protein]-cysteine S-methyltransferase
MHIEFDYYHNAHAELVIATYQERVCLVMYRDVPCLEVIKQRLLRQTQSSMLLNSNALIDETRQQLDDYFTGKRKAFSLPCVAIGTDFQKAVWHHVDQLDYGEVVSYAELAHRCERPDAVRAVANAIRVNPINIVTPCHRIIGKNGQATGYSGGVDMKHLLLKLEQRFL